MKRIAQAILGEADDPKKRLSPRMKQLARVSVAGPMSILKAFLKAYEKADVAYTDYGEGPAVAYVSLYEDADDILQWVADANHSHGDDADNALMAVKSYGYEDEYFYAHDLTSIQIRGTEFILKGASGDLPIRFAKTVDLPAESFL